MGAVLRCSGSGEDVWLVRKNISGHRTLTLSGMPRRRQFDTRAGVYPNSLASLDVPPKSSISFESSLIGVIKRCVYKNVKRTVYQQTV